MQIYIPSNIDESSPLLDNFSTPEGGYVLAHEYCAPECLHYHSMWPVLSVTGQAATPYTHKSFYRDGLTSAMLGEDTESRPLKILIAGSADHTMVAMVTDHVAELKADVEITLADKCRTPLIRSGLFAQSRGVPITLLQLDLSKPGAFDAKKANFDVICSDLIYGYFRTPDGKQGLLNNFSSWLRPEGTLLTVSDCSSMFRTSKFNLPPEVLARLQVVGEVAKATVPPEDLLSQMSCMVIDNFWDAEQMAGMISAAGMTVQKTSELSEARQYHAFTAVKAR